ncbi:MAG: class I SAM-dependent methyltransferase [Gemmatimonadota bacterium]|nr:MAG: class I SAM-dependent methyltransferase [Gemmatimonadota bacterium]
MTSGNHFWEQQEQVEKFAAREPDLRLTGLLKTYPEPSSVRVLDLGCAGGRNTGLLARDGFDFHAVDSAAAMVARTRERVAQFVGDEIAERRVRLGRMEDLGDLRDETFGLVVALGIYHQAESHAHWNRALAETHRVLGAGGLVLTSTFSPRSQPRGMPLRPVPGEEHMYDGFSSGPLCLVTADEWDAAMLALGFVTHSVTETVRVETEGGFRVTVNGLYCKAAGEGPRPDEAMLPR